MRKWNEYKKTFAAPSLFDFARTGDLQGLANLLTVSPQLDLNQKNHKGYSALMLSIYNGQEVFAEALLRSGADANSQDYVGNTILMGAAFKGDPKLVELLLSYGADLNIRNASHMTAYDWAKTFGRKEVMEFIRKKSTAQIQEASLVRNYFNFFKLSLKMLFYKK